MKPRTCPNCGYQYSFFQHTKKYFFRSVFSTCVCENCKALLEIDARRRILLAILGIFPVGLLPHMVDFFMGYYLGSTISWIATIVLLLIWAIYIFSFDKFLLKQPA